MVSRWLIEKATARLRRDGRTAARFTLHLSPMGAASIAGSIKCAPSQDTLTFMRINRGLWRAA